MVTIADVARHAGVAPSTVSYVLTGRRPISDETKSRVQESIRLLGYRTRRDVQVRGGNSTSVVAMILPLREGVHAPVLMRIVSAAVTTARRHDMEVLLVTADRGAQGLRQVAGNPRVEGFLMTDVEMDDERIAVLREFVQPLVLIGQPAVTKGLTCVDLDFRAAGARCVEYLADLGHRSVGFLGAPSVVYRRNTAFAHRLMAGFTAAALRKGVTWTALPTEGDYKSVLRAIEELLAAHPMMSALVVHNEAAVGWVLTALRVLGRRVPEDVAVVAVCPDDVAEQMSPPLTSVRMPAEELGRQAVELLAGRLGGRPAPPVTLLEPCLSERASTTRAAGRTRA